MIGTEYIVSERIFNDLPEDEKQYWHPTTMRSSQGSLLLRGYRK